MERVFRIQSADHLQSEYGLELHCYKQNEIKYWEIDYYVIGSGIQVAGTDHVRMPIYEIDEIIGCEQGRINLKIFQQPKNTVIKLKLKYYKYYLYTGHQ